MKRVLLLIPAAALLMGATSSESMFDGTYRGALQPTPGMSGPACAPGVPLTATVTNGKFAAPQLNGYVNIKGFVQGKMQIGDRALPFEGRVDDNAGRGERLVVGLIDDQTNCAWTMDLAKD